MTAAHPDLADLDPHPLREFARWFELAAGSEELPEAVALSTVRPDGQPTSRMVLMKGHDDDGLEFYTSYDSAKAADIAHEPRVALLFSWKSLRRQVRLEGTARRVTRQASESYWQTRPRGARLAAWASTQSAEIADRSVLEQAVSRLEAEYPGEVPLPPDWGGFHVTPRRVEFFINRQDRLHDRFLYELVGPDAWRRARLSP